MKATINKLVCFEAEYYFVHALSKLPADGSTGRDAEVRVKMANQFFEAKS